MIDNSLVTFYARDLDRFYREIEAYSDEKLLWKKVEGISNSGGNLGVHLVGNLNTYIGKILGNIDYIRDRKAEFTAIISQKELLIAIEETEKVVIGILAKMTLQDFEKIYPIEELGQQRTTEYFLIHWLGHLNYHLGQINYHRRIVR